MPFDIAALTAAHLSADRHHRHCCSIRSASCGSTNAASCSCWAACGRSKDPGLVIIIPFIQQMVRVDLRTRVFDVPPQDVISRDNVSVRVNAVIYYRIIDPEKIMRKRTTR